ncbi:hypothetical protein [Kitasatospora sp. NBC_01300]|uniref:hypothetical protein n=1 Tax=Kitasatospora sp. NBC_01300 TaxID=2903574 RepID=UPI00352F48B6|nr:hypothetical protein OG556_18420 [Kitasatospora sp. NBC_01300]
MSAAAADRRPDDVELLLHLVEQAERGALLPDEAALLREGIVELARYRQWCAQWSTRHARLRRTAHQRLRALQRALPRAQRGRLVEVELAHVRARLDAGTQQGVEAVEYERLLAAELLDGWALARGRARVELAAAGLQPTAPAVGAANVPTAPADRPAP